MKLFSNIIIGCLSVISINAVANDPNQFNYVGISFQNNDYDDLNFSPSVDTAALAPLIYKADSSESGFRGFVGHQFNRYVAIEAGVSSFGKAGFSVIKQTKDSKNNLKNETLHSGKFKTLAGDVRIIGTYPLGDNLFVKAHIGALVWNNEFNNLIQNTEKLLVEKKSDTGVSLVTGLGLGYGFNNKVAISLDFENNGNSSNINAKSRTLNYYSFLKLRERKRLKCIDLFCSSFILAYFNLL